MKLHDKIKQLEQSDEYKKWDKGDFYLAHAFVMQDEQNKNIWQIGYFNDKKDRMITFIIEEDKISVTPEQEVMKAEQHIDELDLSQVKISVEDAIKTAENCIKEHYSKEVVSKSFFIIQHLDKVTVFNVTYLTHSFKTINVKVNALDGTIVKHSIGTLADFS